MFPQFADNLSIQLLVFIVSGFLMIKAASLFVDNATIISFKLNLPKIFIGSTIVSLLTVTPEFIVSVSSNWIGESGVAVGNVVGSCICNIGLILAVGVMIRSIRVGELDVKYRLTFLVGVLVIVYLFMLDRSLGRGEGIALLILLVFFLVFNYRLAKKSGKTENADQDLTPSIPLRKSVLLFLTGGVLTVLLARYGMVDTGLNIARLLDVSPIVVGLTMLALGTSLPELITSIVSSRKNHGELAMGNVFGANVLNLLFVLGVAVLVRPIPIDEATITFNMPVAIGMAVLMLIFGKTKYTFMRFEGVVLLVAYLLYLVALFFMIY